MSVAYMQVHFGLDFLSEANNMNPDGLKVVTGKKRVQVFTMTFFIGDGAVDGVPLFNSLPAMVIY